jgi:enediyne polyketide synthase
MPADILVIGMAAHYAGARGLAQLWETVLTRRPGFRAFPARRLPPDYIGDERDLTYVTRAALIDGFVFDWKARRVPKAAFEATDPVHWLALATAGDAIADSGADLDAVGRERIGVILGNSLTGEVSRANLLRLRWPYVRRAVAAGAARAGLDASATAALLADTEDAYKAGLPVPNEDTLAGALSNVIAGRICYVLDI